MSVVSSIEIVRDNLTFASPQQDVFNQLPKDIFMLIFSQFKGFEVASFKLVCKYFKLISETESLWQLFFKQDFSHKKLLPGDAEPQYVHRYCIENNWNKKKPNSSVLIKTRYQSYTSELKVRNDQLFVQEDYSSIAVRNKISGELVQTIDLGQNPDDLYIKINDNFLCCFLNSGPTGGAFLQIWDLNNFTRLCEINNCLSGYDYAVKEKFIIGMGYHGQFNFCWMAWNWQGKVLQILEGKDFFVLDETHVFVGEKKGSLKKIKQEGWVNEASRNISPICLLSLYGNDLSVGLTNGIVQFYNKEDLSLKMEFQVGNSLAKIKSVTFKDKLLIVKSSLPEKVQLLSIFDKETAVLFYSIEDFSYHYIIHEKLLIVAHRDGSVTIRNINDGSIFQTLPKPSIQEGSVTKLEYDGKRIIVQYREKFKVWSNEGVCLWESEDNNSVLKIEDDLLIYSSSEGQIHLQNFGRK